MNNFSDFCMKKLEFLLTVKICEKIKIKNRFEFFYIINVFSLSRKLKELKFQ